MRYVYFTKTLQSLDLAGVIAFLKEAGLDGADLTVRPGYPVTPDNALTELPKASKRFQDAGLTVGLVTAPTNLNDPEGKAAQTIFEACGKAGVAAVKIGYLTYQPGKFDAQLAEARKRLAGGAADAPAGPRPAPRRRVC
jgi:sugar phosphate isomerase/epimerase